ncbi:unnamed protein product [Triticum turgidum subsp. durum]|uniref:peroxidase n=1 Tax=Triticum turgidum subsp. durum TaxID=4567 RepID=A0A9R1RFE5_TRITD|nr:unnamed protein product [Triticum turgidum subsp. durum]
MASRAAAAAVVVLALVCAVQSSLSAATAGGLSPDFHAVTCPPLEQIVAFHVGEAFKNDSGVAPALIRILFHDCFPQGCDGSVLIEGPGTEQDEIPNKTLRRVALDLIDRIRMRVHSACSRTVSCADITVLATRESLVLAGGPRFEVALGRRDSFFPASPVQVGLLPAPFHPVDKLIKSFGDRGLNVTDLVALSGAHTFGVAHCPAFDDRFKNGFDTNPAIDPKFATGLRNKCAKDTPEGTLKQNLDVRTPDVFDNKYYFDLIARQGLFKSDQGLFDHPTTKRMATRFSLNQDAFFEQFARSMAKMVNMDLLTGDRGEIRARCAVRGTPPRIQAAAAGDDEGISADIFPTSLSCKTRNGAMSLIPNLPQNEKQHKGLNGGRQRRRERGGEEISDGRGKRPETKQLPNPASSWAGEDEMVVILHRVVAPRADIRVQGGFLTQVLPSVQPIKVFKNGLGKEGAVLAKPYVESMWANYVGWQKEGQVCLREKEAKRTNRRGCLQ